VRTIYESDPKSKDDGNCGEQRDPLGLLRRRHVGPRDGPIRVKLVGLLALTGWATVELQNAERLCKEELTTRCNLIICQKTKNKI
jgi:hypothetical protein